MTAYAKSQWQTFPFYSESVKTEQSICFSAEHYSVMKDKFESFVGEWMHAESVMLNEINQTQKAKYLTIIWFLLHGKPKIYII